MNDERTPLDGMMTVQELPLEHKWVNEVAEIVGNSTQHGKRFTGARIAKGDPEKYGRIVLLRSMGMGVHDVAKVEKCSPQTVTAVMRIEEAGRTAEAYRAEVGAKLGVVVNMGVDALIERLADPKLRKKISARDLAIIVEKIGDKRELLTGGATNRTESGRTAEEREEEARRHAEEARKLLNEGSIVDIVDAGEVPKNG